MWYEGKTKEQFSVARVITVIVTLKKMGLSTHILDTSRGKPAPNVAISLFRETDSSNWTKEGEGRTDSDGRYRGFFADQSTAFQVGTYKLRFEVGQYYEQLKIDTLYPYVEVGWILCSSDSTISLLLYFSDCIHNHRCQSALSYSFASESVRIFNL